MVRYYGYYTSVRRGKRKKKGMNELRPSILEPEEPPKPALVRLVYLIRIRLYTIKPDLLSIQYW